ncbi:light-harvesting antenna LH1, beta subunit [Thiorhodospira sibirica]|uniref:light-harvesting antenna LH1, beta subunit n=1 Tax=Thiorhodospira sibirica TaxID=154347 RepID=UPI001C8D9CCE|nr:light-harvesting antenna LH1, beta subunit [Thiorhodospira sibirica]
MADVSPSGLTERQAKEFHAQFTKTYTVFVVLAALVHLLVYAIQALVLSITAADH